MQKVYYLLQKNNLVLEGQNKIIVLSNNDKQYSKLLYVSNSIFNLMDNFLFLKRKYFDKQQMRSFVEILKLSIKGIENYFFVHFTIKGLGFRIRRYVKNNINFLRIELGYSHFLYYPVPANIFIVKGKKCFLMYSNDFNLLKRVTTHLITLRKTTVYKEKGLLITDKIYKQKSGKQQTTK